LIIEVIKGRSQTDLVAIGNAIHQALVECLNVPERDRFQIITEHSAGRLLYDSGYLGIERTDGIVFVQVFLSAGRTTEQKKAFYAGGRSSRKRGESGTWRCNHCVG
jgi:4-oxalocrotonate tautomerase